MDSIWQEATDQKERVLVEELVGEVAMYPPHHLEAEVSGVPDLNVTLDEVGLTGVADRSCERGDLHGPQGDLWRLRPWEGTAS